MQICPLDSWGQTTRYGRIGVECPRCGKMGLYNRVPLVQCACGFMCALSEDYYVVATEHNSRLVDNEVVV